MVTRRAIADRVTVKDSTSVVVKLSTPVIPPLTWAMVISKAILISMDRILGMLPLTHLSSIVTVERAMAVQSFLPLRAVHCQPHRTEIKTVSEQRAGFTGTQELL